jgi:hypothetical protein
MYGKSYGFHRVFNAPDWMKKAARRAANEAAADLGLPRVFIEYWEPDGPHAMKMAAWANKPLDVNDQHWSINLVPSKLKDEDQLRCVVFHECRHLWQDKHVVYTDLQRAENDANEYSYQKTRIIYGFDRRDLQ